MLVETSEQRLKALEHSKNDPNDLLDEAAAIAETKFDSLQRRYDRLSLASSRQSNTLREEWLLRWILKRFNEAVLAGKDKKQNAALHRFLLNVKAWSFLLYLLSIIEKQKSLEILLQRNITKIFTNTTAILLEDHQSTSTTNPSPLADGDATEPPRKKLRLSPDSHVDGDVLVSEDSTYMTENSCLFQYVKVVHLLGSLLQSTEPLTSDAARVVAPAWAETINEAAQFISSILESAKCLLGAPAKSSSSDVVATTVSSWMGLWHNFASSNNSIDRTAAGRVFTETCLVSCLELYGSVSESTQPTYITAKKELEKLIALYTILPLRSIFSTKNAGKWKSTQITLSWQDIEPVFKTVTNYFGSALRLENAAGTQITCLHDAKHASYLLSVATRLVPKHDVRQRLKEGPWIEALLLCLAHLAFPREMPKMEADTKGILRPQLDHLLPIGNILKTWPNDLLNIVLTEELHITATTREYLVTSILSWASQPLPLPLVCMIVSLDANGFVPNVGGKNSRTCLDGILAVISAHRVVNEDQYDMVIEGLIRPMFQAFARARELPDLINMWLPRLEDALRIRSSAVFEPESVPFALIWDDEDVFAEFSKQCRQNAAMSFGQTLLHDVTQEMQNMPERIGPTTDIFAKLAVLESFVKGKGKDVLTSMGIMTSLNTLSDLMVDAVQQKNDYQGQRWRLWSFMMTLVNIDAQFTRFDGIISTLKASIEQFDSAGISAIGKLQQGQRSALLRERYTIFSLLLTHHTLRLNNDEMSRMLRQMTSTVLGLVEEFSIADAARNNMLWDGRSNNLRDNEQFVQACLARLVQHSSGSNSKDITEDGLLSTLESSRDVTKEAGMRYVLSLLDSLLLKQEHSVASMTKHSSEKTTATLSFHNSTHEYLERIAKKAQTEVTKTKQMENAPFLNKSSQANDSDDLTEILSVSALVLEVDDDDLRARPELANMIASHLTLDKSDGLMTSPKIVLQLELCMLILKLQSNIVHQATIDRLLTDLATFSSSALRFEGKASSMFDDHIAFEPQIIFDRLVGVIGILLAKYRRRLAGRTHLLIPVLQNLLKCFFYTPNRTYIYQNAATSKQKQTFRSSLPAWLNESVLPVSSAVKFSKILSSLCNPTTASARSAHRTRRNSVGASLALNDETKKAKRIAAQYMQYLIMEYARSTLDGVIQPDVREKLTPGIYSILDAMDRDLMKAMNSAMDPSSRAIFKGLYDDWVKHWRWNQN